MGLFSSYVADRPIQKRNPELYSQLGEYVGDLLQLQVKQEIIESPILGSSEDSNNCCIIC